jgi:hypothetical protein
MLTIFEIVKGDRQNPGRYLIKILDYSLSRAKTGATSRIPFPAIFVFSEKSKNSNMSLGKVNPRAVLQGP